MEIPSRKARSTGNVDAFVAGAGATAADNGTKKKKEVPFLLEFKDIDLRNDIRMEAFRAGKNMSEYIVEILRLRDSIVKKC